MLLYIILCVINENNHSNTAEGNAFLFSQEQVGFNLRNNVKNSTEGLEY